jgi:hypothetical protein
MHRLVHGYVLIKFIRIYHGAVFHTGRTPRAPVLDNISGLFNQLYLEISLFSFDAVNFGIAQDLYVWMPADLDQFG